MFGALHRQPEPASCPIAYEVHAHPAVPASEVAVEVVLRLGPHLLGRWRQRASVLRGSSCLARWSTARGDRLGPGAAASTARMCSWASSTPGALPPGTPLPRQRRQPACSGSGGRPRAVRVHLAARSLQRGAALREPRRGAVRRFTTAKPSRSMGATSVWRSGTVEKRFPSQHSPQRWQRWTETYGPQPSESEAPPAGPGGRAQGPLLDCSEARPHGVHVPPVVAQRVRVAEVLVPRLRRDDHQPLGRQVSQRVMYSGQSSTSTFP